MSMMFSSGTERTPGKREAPVLDSDRAQRYAPHRIDSNAVRWVVAGTIAFWLVVYAAGSQFF